MKLGNLVQAYSLLLIKPPRVAPVAIPSLSLRAEYRDRRHRHRRPKMAEEPPSATSTIPSGGAPVRRSFTGDESSQSRHRPQSNRYSMGLPDAPSPGVRRRSSNLSDYSMNEARRSFQSSTDDLLLPKPSATGHEVNHESSHWDSAPLAFALLPALGGMLFKNGSSVITDIMLLGLAAIFLNWSVRLPWSVSQGVAPSVSY